MSVSSRVIVFSSLLLLSVIGCLASTQGAKEQTPAPKSQAVAFVNVNVVPMDRERVLENQTVIVRAGRIAQIGPAAKTKAPEGALVVDGRGKYLMPGLAEMHGHLPHPNMSEQVANSILFLYMANGVTTVRGMFGFPNHVALRDRVARGEIPGPTVYVASPALSGQSVPSPEEGERLVREYKKAGFDLLKVHEGLSKAAYDRIVAVAGEVGIPFGGHVANDVGVLHALKSKQSTIEHLDGYIEALEADDSPIKNADPQTRAQKLVNYVDERKIAQLAAATREAGVWNVPTLALWQTFMGTETPDSLRQRPEIKYMPVQMVNQWVQQRNNQLQQNNNPETGKRIIELRNKMLKALSDAGAKILLGSDAPQLFSVPGFSLHREMQAMVKAGLTPYQILESGTRNVALYFKTLNETGTVEVGKRADLILVEGNPLQDVANVAKRAGVMARGKWYPESEIRKKLDEIAAMAQPQPSGKAETVDQDKALTRANPSQPIFDFYNGFWINLHHVLYEQARRQRAGGQQTGGAGRVTGLIDPDSLSGDEQRELKAALDFYAGALIKRDLLFDEGMTTIKLRLAESASAPDLQKSGLQAELIAALERAAPIYRKHWWAEHERANRDFINKVTPLVEKFGRALKEQLTAAFRAEWQDKPLHVDVVRYANWAGAYTSNEPTHITVSSTDPRHQDYPALETLFHEASHALVRRSSAVVEGIIRESRAQNKPVPRDLWHAVLFYTTGEAVKRALASNGVSGYVPYAYREGLYARAWPQYQRALERHWQSYLDGKISFDSALAALVADL